VENLTLNSAFLRTKYLLVPTSVIFIWNEQTQKYCALYVWVCTKPLCYYVHSWFPISEKPVVTTPFAVIKGEIGKPLNLTCISEGSPPDTFIWRKFNQQIQDKYNEVTYTSSIAVFQSSYSITSFSTNDIGIYSCKVTNPIGNDSKYITVNTDYGKCNCG